MSFPIPTHPGHWTLYDCGREIGTYADELACLDAARSRLDIAEGMSICWEANIGDPRYGDVGFTPFYCAYRQDTYGIRMVRT